MEVRPRIVPRDAHRASGKYAALYAEQRQAMADLAAPQRPVDAFFFVNGLPVGQLLGVHEMQPVVPSNKYRTDSAEDAKGVVRRPQRGFTGCRFAVRLCAEAGAAMYDLTAASPSNR